MIDTGNPYYAPEEFTYNQDPLELPTIEAEIEPLDTNEILESGAEFSIRPRGERRADTVFQERSDVVREKVGKSVDFDRILSERLSRSSGLVKLVNTIEYQAGDYKGRLSQALSGLSLVDVQAAVLRTSPPPTGRAWWAGPASPPSPTT